MKVKVNEIKLTEKDCKELKVEINFDCNNGKLSAAGVADSDVLSKRLQHTLFKLFRDIELELGGTDTSDFMSTYSNCEMKVVEGDTERVACSIITKRLFDKDKFNLNKLQLEDLYSKLGAVLGKNEE